jgi:hypothetical protein
VFFPHVDFDRAETLRLIDEIARRAFLSTSSRADPDRTRMKIADQCDDIAERFCRVESGFVSHRRRDVTDSRAAAEPLCWLA